MMDGVVHRVSSPTFVGRVDELAALEAALARAAGGVPAFAFVAGESGVGKSRLIAEFESGARRAGARVFIGHCLELGGTVIPYAPLVDALRPLARELAESGSDLPELLPPPTRAALAELLPEFGAGDAPSSGGEGEGGVAPQSRIFEGLLALLDRLGREQPIVLVLEDLHWADPSTRDFLTFLVRSARSEPLCLVVSYRSDELHRRHPLRPLLAELERSPHVDRLGLERFNRDEVGLQVSAILEAPAPEELADELFERAYGNPLYTEELLAASSEGCLELPETLRDALLHRVERLPAAAQEVVRVASVEHPMRHELLVALCPLAPAETLEGLREAVAHQILVSESDGAYAFRHALVGEAVYSDLLPGERSALHARLAEALEREPQLLGDAPRATLTAQLACHWHNAHDVPRALGAAVAAGFEAKRVFAFSEAKRHFERALELWDRVPDAAERAGCDRIDVLRHAAAAASNSGEAARSVALIRQAIAEVDAQAEPERAAFLLERLGHYLRGAGETEEGLEAYERAMALLPPGESPQRATLLELRSRALMLRGRFTEAADGAAEALAMAERLDEPRIQSRALNTLGLNRAALDDVDEGAALLRRSREVAARTGPPSTLVQAVINLGEILDLAGRTEEALAEVRDCLEVVRAHPERTTYDTFLELQGANFLIRLGRLDEVEESLSAAPPGDSVGTTPIFLHELRARVRLIRGELPAARRQLDEMRRLCLGTRDPQWIEPLHTLTGLLALLEDRAGDARAAAEQGLAAIASSDEGGRIARLCWVGLQAEADAAELSRPRGEPFDRGSAERLLAALADAAAKPGQWAEGPLYAALARAEAGRLDHALGVADPDPAAWEAVATGFDRLRFPWPAAYSRFRAAEAYVQAGDRAGAAAPLSAAHEAAAAMRAAPLLGEIEALGRRGRVELEAPAAATNGDTVAVDGSPAERLGLTPREREVLLLLAEGRTNREIGQALFMSEKTASVHVSRILTKLGVSRRVEAAAVAYRLGLTSGGGRLDAAAAS
jgi:DNA-binding CsgD family transcriptional regulator/tetratricopeptide (TPR) repeat protein